MDSIDWMLSTCNRRVEQQPRYSSARKVYAVISIKEMQQYIQKMKERFEHQRGAAVTISAGELSPRPGDKGNKQMGMDKGKHCMVAHIFK